MVKIGNFLIDSNRHLSNMVQEKEATLEKQATLETEKSNSDKNNPTVVESDPENEPENEVKESVNEDDETSETGKLSIRKLLQ